MNALAHPVVVRLFDRVQEVCPEYASGTGNPSDPTAYSKGRSRQSVEIDGKYYNISWMAVWGLEIEISCAEDEYSRPRVIAKNYIDGKELFPREWKTGDLLLLNKIVKLMEKQARYQAEAEAYSRSRTLGA